QRAQHVGTADVQVVTEERGEEPVVKSLERALALTLGTLRGRQRRDAGGRQRRVDLRGCEAGLRLLGADALPPVARLRGDAPIRLFAGDEWERSPVKTHAIAVGLLDLAQPYCGVVAPRALIVGEDVQPDRCCHSRVNTVGFTTSVRSAWSACSTMR